MANLKTVTMIKGEDKMTVKLRDVRVFEKIGYELTPADKKKVTAYEKAAEEARNQR